MNIDITQKINTSSTVTVTTTPTVQKDNNGKFAEELKTLKKEKAQTQEIENNSKTETASNAADMWNHDIIDQEFYDLIKEDFSKPIYQALNIMASNVERRAQKIGYKNPNVQGPLK